MDLGDQTHLRIATRESPLAQWQARYVAERLQAATPGLVVDLVTASTAADDNLSISISELGGKGAFCKEIQRLVLAGKADIAVHSAKDMPSTSVEGLTVAAFCERGDARDVLIGTALADLAPGAVVATGSNRRRALLADLRPDVQFAELRGNIDTRLEKASEFDAIVMAAAALQRLEKLDELASPVDYLDPSTMVPQVGQGALAVECRTGDQTLQDLVSSIDHAPTHNLVAAERAFLVELGGDCELPAGAHATFVDDSGVEEMASEEMVGKEMVISGVLAPAPISGAERPPLYRETVTGSTVEIGTELAQRLQKLVDEELVDGQ